MNEVASLHPHSGHVDRRVELDCRRACSARLKQSQIKKLPKPLGAKREYDIADDKTKSPAQPSSPATPRLFTHLRPIYYLLKDASIYKESSRRNGQSHRGRQNRLHSRHVQSELTVLSPCMEKQPEFIPLHCQYPGMRHHKAAVSGTWTPTELTWESIPDGMQRYPWRGTRDIQTGTLEPVAD